MRLGERRAVLDKCVKVWIVSGLNDRFKTGPEGEPRDGGGGGSGDVYCDPVRSRGTGLVIRAMPAAVAAGGGGIGGSEPGSFGGRAGELAGGGD